MVSLFKGIDDYQHLFVVDLIIIFHGIKTLRVEDNRVPLPILLRLLEEDLGEKSELLIST